MYFLAWMVVRLLSADPTQPAPALPPASGRPELGCGVGVPGYRVVRP
jgi:hypothetical protein